MKLQLLTALAIALGAPLGSLAQNSSGTATERMVTEELKQWQTIDPLAPKL